MYAEYNPRLIPIQIPPTINDSQNDFKWLFNTWQLLQNEIEAATAYSHPALVIQLDFSNCRFLRPNAVAFLGGIVESLQQQGLLVSVKPNSLKPSIRKILIENDFLTIFGEETVTWSGNSVPYRHFADAEQTEGIIEYLDHQWLSRKIIGLDQDYKDDIIHNTLEIYANAFEHSLSDFGVFSCGQFFPNMKQLNLTVIDFGAGIPEKVQGFVKDIIVTSPEALKWCFESGTSTRKEHVPGGDGLNSLKNFVQESQGIIEVYSHNGYAHISNYQETYEAINTFFRGTLINISVKIG